MAYGHTFADDVKPMVQNRSENFAIYRGTKVNSFQAFEFLFQQVVAESREELRTRAQRRLFRLLEISAGELIGVSQ